MPLKMLSRKWWSILSKGQHVKSILLKYHETSNISHTLVGSKIVHHAAVVGALPIAAAPTTSSFSTPGFNGLGKNNCKMRQETFKFWDFVSYIRGLRVTKTEFNPCSTKHIILMKLVALIWINTRHYRLNRRIAFNEIRLNSLVVETQLELDLPLSHVL